MTGIDPVADKKVLIVKVGLLEVVNHSYHIMSGLWYNQLGKMPGTIDFRLVFQ